MSTRLPGSRPPINDRRSPGFVTDSPSAASDRGSDETSVGDSLSLSSEGCNRIGDAVSKPPEMGPKMSSALLIAGRRGRDSPGTTVFEGKPVGFSYRKSFKAGPVRVTASKSGISYSAGVKGARVTKRADGRVQTTLSAPGTGVRHTTSHGRPSARQAASRGVVRQAPRTAARTPSSASTTRGLVSPPDSRASRSAESRSTRTVWRSDA
ncbi:DUF4236 domain-containing protein [Streptomyces mirabilis]|uniref:DUF4236 domain-containing protein n=1 Tax=Streptomyces mirabilis TaxID=68239 RepID=UPI0033CA2FD6